MTDAYIIDAVRTPRGIGKAGKGSLSHFHSGRLLAKVLEQVQARNDLNTEDVDDVVVGCSTQVGNQGACVGRMATLDAGWSTNASAVTLDRFCGSGITSVCLSVVISTGRRMITVPFGKTSRSVRHPGSPKTTSVGRPWTSPRKPFRPVPSRSG